MQQSSDPPGGPSKAGPDKCTQCGRGNDPPGGPPDPKPWKCSHCKRDFDTEVKLKTHLRRTNCQYPHNGTQKPGKGRTWDLQWKCPRCNVVLRSKYSAERHVKNLCWKICDECTAAGEFGTCSLQHAGYTDSACTSCIKKGIPCSVHTSPIAGDPVPVPRDTAQTDDLADQENDNHKRAESSPPGKPAQKKPRTGRQSEVVPEPLGTDDEGYNPTPPPRSQRAPPRSVYLLPQEPETTGLWVPRGTIFDPSDIPWAAEPPKKPQEPPRVPSLSTTEALQRAYTGRVETAQSNIPTGFVPSFPPIPTGEDPMITIHIRNLDRSAQQAASQTITLRRPEFFGPHLNQYCEFFGRRFQQDWVFVWFSANPLPGAEDNVRGTVIHWHYTPLSFGPPRFPRMGPYEYFYVFRSEDERVRNVLRVDLGDQAAVNAHQRSLRADSEHRSDNQITGPFPYRGDNTQERQGLATNAYVEDQVRAGPADETPDQTGQQHEGSSADGEYEDDDDLYADP